MLAFLRGRGFVVIRILGSHHVVANGSLHTVVPIHGHEVLKIGTLHGILRDIRMSAEQFSDEWRA
jgi:predicted RNA binding protein YcfA (HicA-like mRNA interferase family)